MKKFLFGALIALSAVSAFSADYQATHGGDVLTARGGVACKPAVVEKLAGKAPAELLPQFRHMDAFVDGKKYDACWVQHGDGIFFVYEDGDVGALPVTAFHELKTV